MPEEMIAHYRITGKLGAGGMGEVYLATDIKLDREVAIKLLPVEIADNPQRRRRFLGEAKAASALNHPNVCTVYEVGETEDGQPFIAMEFLPGQTLDSLARQEPMDTELLVNIGIQIADALDAAHQAGIIHRDIKPANVHVDAQNRVKVLDFGLAKRADTEGARDTDATTLEETEPGKVMGTMSYMSPEQARGEVLDHRSDLFSLGIVLYQLTTGRLPFTGSSFAETVEKITHSEPNAIARFNYEVSSELERIIRKCLEKKPEERYQSARELLIDFKRLRRDSETGVSRLPDHEKSWWKPLGVAAGIALVAMAVAGIWGPQRNNATERQNRFGISVAVMPFKADEDYRYASDGLGGELSGGLNRLDSIERVPPFSSSERLRGDNLDLPSIAEQLRVSTLLQGSIRRSGQTLIISAELVDPFSNTLLWHDSYPYDQVNELPFPIYKEIAQSIAKALDIELSSDQEESLTTEYTTSPRAWEAYLEGRYYWARRGPDLWRARELFELALSFDSPTGRAEDSRMAPAYVGLADTYNLMGFYGDIPTREGTALGRRYIDRALEIDEHMSQAFATLGWSKMMECDGTGADQAFRRAIELDDQMITALLWHAALLGSIGEFERGQEQVRRVLELDPVSPGTRAVAAWQLVSNRESEEARHELIKVIADAPEYEFAHFVMGETLMTMKEPEKAISSYREAVRLSQSKTFYRAGLAMAYAAAGQEEKAREVIIGLEPEAYSTIGSYRQIAVAHLFLDEKEKCYQILEAYLSESGGDPFLATHPHLEILQSEARFIKIVNESGLLKYNPTTEAYEPNP